MTTEAEAGVDAAAHPHPSYVKIWGVLVALLVVSVLGPELGVPLITIIAAFGVALVKAYLVVRYFMHVSVEPKYVAYLLGSMVGFVVLFYAGVAPDVQLHEGHQWTNLAARAEVERALGGTEESAAPADAPFVAAQEFASTCGVCHGTGGAGDGPAAAALDPHPANFTDPAFWESRDRASILRVVSEGGAALGRSPLMPSFGDRYADEELAALVDHVISLAPEGAAVHGAEDTDAADAADADAGAPAAASAPEAGVPPHDAHVTPEVTR